VGKLGLKLRYFLLQFQDCVCLCVCVCVCVCVYCVFCWSFTTAEKF